METAARVEVMFEVVAGNVQTRLHTMPPIARQLSLAVMLLTVWVVTALATQLWLKAEATRMLHENAALQSGRFDEAVDLFASREPGWSEASAEQIVRLLGVAIEVRDGPPPADLAVPINAFVRPLPDGTDRYFFVMATPAAAERLSRLHQRMWLLMGLVALFLIMIPVIVGLTRRPHDPAPAASPAMDPAKEIRALEHLARISEERSTALKREASARLVAEQSLERSQSLLDESEEKHAQLGRDLHDNLCQTLYAVSLSIEGARRRLRSDPDDVERRLDACISELRSANREIRNYIAGLTARDGAASFPESLNALIDSFSTLAGVNLKRYIDARAAETLDAVQAREMLQFVREAVSNSIRHAHAQEITIALEAAGDGSPTITVADDGRGFDPAAESSTGHGLANMQARAAAARGTLQVTSSPGTGTHVRITLPSP